MKLPSLKTIASDALLTIKRFPWVMLLAFTATIASIYLIESENIKFKTPEYDSILKIIIMSVLGIPLLLSVSLYLSRKRKAILFKYVLNLLSITLLIIYYFLWNDTAAHLYRYALYFIAAHLLVTYSSYIADKNQMAYWQFSKVLFLRLINSLFFSIALQIGLVMAVLAIEKLFNVEWKIKVYADLAVIVFGIFNTWYFLTGLPDNTEEIDNSNEYPKILKLFSQFILIPLALVYLIILYAYEIKIIVQWSLPIGWVSSLIITFAGVGILTLLLVFPISNDENNKWIKIFSKLFFFLLYPLLILLFLAITERISEYGITEPRYFLIVIVIWLTLITLYYSFSKIKNIKLIPVSLLYVTILISFGPWGAFKVSENSQISRFMKILNEKKILVDKKITISKAVDSTDVDNIKSIFNYLNTTHRLRGLITELKQQSNIKVIQPEDSLLQSELLDALMIDSTIRDKNKYDFTKFKDYDLSESIKEPIDINGYNYFITFNSSHISKNKSYEINLCNDKMTIIDSLQTGKLDIFLNNNQHKTNISIFEIIKHLESLQKDQISEKDFIKSYNIDKYELLLILERTYGMTKKNSEIGNYKIDILIKAKP